LDVLELNKTIEEWVQEYTLNRQNILKLEAQEYLLWDEKPF
jgi:hypothetical protein